uniref:Uncharacterized protein n=1 Tax=Ditylenchus dipsaci TaxID=166011 RepID=A0A915D3P3_9BILA
MDPEKVKYIMSSQIAPLSRVLGGIHIEELRLAEFRKRRPPADNTRLTNMMIVLGIGIGFCYFVVAVKQFNHLFQRLATKTIANTQKDQTEKKSTRNYGTCTDHLLSNYEALNGKPKSKAIPSQKKKNITATFSNDIDGKRVVVSQSTPAFEPKKYQNMFACDPSQLPQEVFHMSEMVKPIEDKHYQTKGKSSQSDLDDDDAFLPEAPFQTTNRQSVSGTVNLPSVILVSSISQENVPEKNNNKKLELYPPSAGAAAFLDTGVKANPYERPLSRRGSRESTPEQGEEEYEDNRDTPQPIGDEVGIESMLQEGLKKDLSMTLKFKAPSSNRQNSPTWTSDSGDEEETGTVYHQLENDIHASDEEEVKQRAHKTFNKEIPVINRLLPTFHSEEISDSENEYGEPNETKVLDRHHYERLQESPIPNSFTNEEIRQATLERESSLDMRQDE